MHGIRMPRNWRSGGAGLATLALVGSSFLLAAPVAHADVTTMSNDTARTSYDGNEPGLTPADVSASDFGKQHDITLNGQIYATPIVVGNTAFVATETNDVYGVDVPSGKILWHRNNGAPFLATTLTTKDGSCSDLTPNIGSTSTGVYDATTHSVYYTTKVVPTGAAQNQPQWFLHSVDLTSGTERSGYPMRFEGTADNDPSITFNPLYQMQRPGLLLRNGILYVGFGAHCDFGDYQGWVMGVNVKGTPTEQTAWVSDAGVKQGGGIWMSGGGIVADPSTPTGDPSIFVTTGNGTSPVAGPGTTAQGHMAESIIKLRLDATGHLKAQDFFSPHDSDVLDQHDTDYGSGAPVALPDSYGTAKVPHLIVTAGKDGRIYILNRDNLGGRGQGPGDTDAVVQSIGPYPTGFWNHAAIYPMEGGWFYIANGAGQLFAFQRGVDANGNPTFTQAGTANENFGYLAGMPQVTSNGTAGTGIVWMTSQGNGTSAGELHAYDAIPQNGTLHQIWSTPVGTATKFVTVATSNGRVITGTRDGHLMIFGRPTDAAVVGSSLDLGSVGVHETGTAVAHFHANSKVTITGASVGAASAFTAGTPSATRVDADGDFTVPVRFTPTTTGSSTSQLVVSYTDATGAKRTTAIDLHGVGLQTGLAFNPSPLNFGEMQTTSYRTMAVNVTNTGSVPEVIRGVVLDGDGFSSSSLPGSGTTIAAGQSLSVPVLFKPGHAGSFSGQLLLSTDSGSYSTKLTGTAVAGAPHMVVSPKSLNFGSMPVGSSSTMDFSVTNDGNVPLQLSLSKAPVGAFTAGGALPESLQIAADSTITEHITFHPTTKGTFSSAYILDGGDGQGHVTIPITGTAVQSATIAGPSSASDSAWQFNGSATMHGKDVQLTTTARSRAGSAFLRQSVPSEGLDARFQVQMNGGNGADGQTFALLPASDPTTAVGNDGGSLGWAGLHNTATGASLAAAPGISVDFDTMGGTRKPVTTLVRIASGFSGTGGFTTVASRTTDGDLRQGTHDVEVSHHNGVLTVLIDGKLFLQAPVKLPAQVHPGFTGSTGMLTDNHVVRNISITAPGLVVQKPTQPTPPAAPSATAPIDARTTATGTGTITTSPIRTTGADRLLALVAADGTPGRRQSASLSSASGGLTWSFVRRTNTRTGTAEIWTATTTRATSNIRVRAKLATSSGGAVTVVAVKGSHSLGGTGSGSGAKGAARASVVRLRTANSWFFAVGDDPQSVLKPSVAASSPLVNVSFDRAHRATFWVQQSAPGLPGGATANMATTAPTSDPWNYTMVEVRR